MVSPRAVARFEVAALALPAVIYFVYVVAFGVNVPNRDDFNVIPLLDKFVHGTLTFGDVWAQHNENRVLVPNVLWILATRLFGDDLKTIMIVDAAMMIAAAWLLFAVWERRAGGSRLALVPAAFLYFTLLQHESALTGFQLSWYLIVLSLALVIYVLDDPRRSNAHVAVAVVAAIVASFSSLQGLFTWPVGVLFLLARDDRARLWWWLGCGALTTIAYFIGYDFGHVGDVGVSSPLAHPFAATGYFILAFGGVFSGNSVSNSAGLELAGLLGAFVLAGLVASIAVALRARVPYITMRLPLALLTFALVFAAAVVVGRSSDVDASSALASRYTTFIVYVPIASYLLLVLALRARPTDLFARYAFVAAAPLLALAILCSLVIGTSIGAYAQGQRTLDIARLRAAATEPDAELQHLWCCPSLIRTYAALARADRLMTFAHDP